MKTLVITTMTDHVNMDCVSRSFHKTDRDALMFLTGYLNEMAKINFRTLKSVEVK